MAQPQSTLDQINSYDLFAKNAGEGGQLGGGHVCLKRTIIGVNAFFILLSIIMMAVGAAGASNIMSQFAGNTLPTGIVVIGVFILLVSLAGCFGAWKENKWVLYVYAVIVIFLVICQIATAIAIYSQQSQIPVILTVAWDNANNFLRVTGVQEPLQCCGLTVFNMSIGASGVAGVPCPEVTRYTQQTCMLPMQTTIQSSFTSVGVVALCFAFLQIIGIGFAFCLIRGIKLAREQDQMTDVALDTAAAPKA